MIFLTAFSVGRSVGQPVCNNTEEPVFSERINDSGVYEVYQSGVRSFQDIINEAYPSTLLENVLARCGVGDFSGLSAKCFYADVTSFPENIHVASSLVNNIRNIFESLPKDQKVKFDSFTDFLEKSGTPGFFETFNDKKVPESNTNKEEE